MFTLRLELLSFLAVALLVVPESAHSQAALAQSLWIGSCAKARTAQTEIVACEGQDLPNLYCGMNSDVVNYFGSAWWSYTYKPSTSTTGTYQGSGGNYERFSTAGYGPQAYVRTSWGSDSALSGSANAGTFQLEEGYRVTTARYQTPPCYFGQACGWPDCSKSSEVETTSEGSSARTTSFSFLTGGIHSDACKPASGLNCLTRSEAKLCPNPEVPGQYGITVTTVSYTCTTPAQALPTKVFDTFYQCEMQDPGYDAGYVFMLEGSCPKYPGQSCPQGWVECSGSCRPRGCNSANPLECSLSGDCAWMGGSCQAGRCVPQLPTPAPQPDSCPPGRCREDGVCKLFCTSACDTDRDCAGLGGFCCGGSCKATRCEQSCRTNNQCRSGETCCAGRCKPSQACCGVGSYLCGATCCPSGNTCTNDICCPPGVECATPTPSPTPSMTTTPPPTPTSPPTPQPTPSSLPTFTPTSSPAPPPTGSATPSQIFLR